MKTWKAPSIVIYNAIKLSKIIKARAWSVESLYNLGEFLDNANVGMRGSVYMDFNEGHKVQVEVIGRVIIGGYLIVTLLTDSGETYSYSRPESGGTWSRY